MEQLPTAAADCADGGKRREKLFVLGATDLSDPRPSTIY
jgi:hypothetical protein